MLKHDEKSKKHGTLEYLDLCAVSAARLLASRPTQKMHGQSVCDCYCKTGAAISRQREEIHSERSRDRNSKSIVSKCSNAVESGRRIKGIPLTPAKLVEDEQLDTRRSTVALPVSPVLSPETSAALEDVEKLIKDAHIRMKEISMSSGSDRHRKHVNVYTENEAFLDDENDHMLYIRERVARKFQEANGWIDADLAATESQRFATAKPRRIVDLSAPKFRISQERYKEFSRRDRGFSPTPPADRSESPRAERTMATLDRAVPETRDDGRVSKTSRKLAACSVQTGPSVNIKGELIVRNLGDVHISPDSSFVPEDQRNVATYVMRHDIAERTSTESPARRREKVVRIVDERNDGNGRSLSFRATKDRSVEGNAAQANSNGTESEANSEVRGAESSRPGIEGYENAAGADPEAADQELVRPGVDDDAGKPVATISRNASLSASCASNDLDSNLDLDPNDRRTGEVVGASGSTSRDSGTAGKESNAEPNVELEDNGEEASSMIRVHRSEQKQVRFDERSLATGERGDLESPARVQGLEASSSADPTGRIGGTVSREDTAPLHCTETLSGPSRDDGISGERVPSARTRVEQEEAASDDKKIREEIRGKRQASKLIEERFASIARACRREPDEKYCPSVDCSTKESFVETSNEFPEDSDESDDLFSLHEPRMNELDTVLRAYGRMIDDVARSTRAIHEFLSRPEMEEYRAEKAARRSGIDGRFPPLPFNARDHEESGRDDDSACRKEEWRTKGRGNAAGNDEIPRIRATRLAPSRKPFIPRTSEERGRNRPATRIAGTLASRLNSRPKDRREPRTSARKESSGSSGSNGRRGRTMESLPRRAMAAVEKDEDRWTRPSASTSSETKASLSSGETTTTRSMIIGEPTAARDQESIIVVGSDKDSAVSETRDLGAERNDAHPRLPIRSCPEELVEKLVGREESSLVVEDKIKSALNVDEVARLIARSLMDNLSGEKSKLVAGQSDGLLVVSGNRSGMENRGVNGAEKSIGDSRIDGSPCDSQEKASETLECEGIVCCEPDHENTVPTRPIRDGEQWSHASEKDSGGSRNELATEFDPDVESLYGDDSAKGIRVLCDGSSQDDPGTVVEEQRQGDRNTESFEPRENKRDDVANVAENITLVLGVKDVTEVTIKSATKAEGMENLLDNTPPDDVNGHSNSNDDVPGMGNGKLVESEKDVAPASNSQADSPRNSMALRTPARNLSESSSLSSNSRLVNDIEETNRGAEGVNAGAATSTNNTRFDDAFDRDRILSDVYSEARGKIFSSTMDTNYSNVLNQHFRFSNGVSTISTIESTKIEISSDPSHSEGELCLPSSGSYSLGEIRVPAKDQSDGEDTDAYGDNITIFVTKEMLTSWNESSKSLVQSIGEI